MIAADKGVLMVALVALMASSCGLFQSNPVPKEYSDFIGTWEGNGVSLVITKDGGLGYKKLSGNGSMSISGPLSEIDANHIKINVLFIVKDFIVDRRPYLEDETMKMVVDGDVLIKKKF